MAEATMAQQQKALKTLDDLVQDPDNANLGTDRGRELLAESIDTCGFGRSILADKYGTVIAGNKTMAQAKAAGAEIEVVTSSGDELVVVQRDDLDLVADQKARQLAYYDNRVQEVDLSWSADQINADVLAGVDIGNAFFPEEIEELASTKTGGFTSVKGKQGPGASADDMEPVQPEGPQSMADPDFIPKSSRPSFTLTFHTTEQQEVWLQFCDLLDRRYPDFDDAGKLAVFLAGRGF